VTDSIML